MRRSEELVALISDVEPSAVDPKTDDAAPPPPRYRTYEITLAKVPASLCPRRDQILTAWKELSAVEVFDQSTLFHVSIVLLNSVPGGCVSSRKLRPLDEFAEPERAGPSAAHPRGFKGTKYQPPKAKRPPVIDLRQYLADSASLRSVGAKLAVHLPQIAKRLHRQGYGQPEVTKCAQLLFHNTRPASRRSPFELGTVSREFAHHFWPLMMTLPDDVRSGYRRLFHQLQLADNRPLLWAVSRLVSLQPDLKTLGWCRLLEGLLVDRRVAFVSRLIESGNYQLEPKVLSPKHLEEVNRITPDELFEAWLERFHWSLSHDIPLAYLLAGFRLAIKFGWRHSFHSLRACTDFPEQVAQELDGLWEGQYGRGYVATLMWERCGELPGFAAIMQRRWLRDVPAQTGFKFFDSIQRCAYYDIPQTQSEKKWDCIRRQLHQIEELILSVPEDYQVKAIGYIFDCLWCWDKPAEIESRLPRLIRVLQRICRPPFRQDFGAADAIEYLTQCDSPALLERLLVAPRKSWRAIEDGCARENRAGLIVRGLEPLIKYHGLLTVDAFISFPKLLMKVAKTVGTLRAPARDQLCQEVSRHPLLICDPLSLPLRDLCRYLASHCGRRYFNPASVKLKAWAQGNADLSPARIARDQRLLMVNLTRTRLEVIEHAVLDRLGKPVVGTLPTKNVRHALQLLSSIDYNRRGLRRFLQAYFSGDQRYLASHPATKHWHRSHPRVNRTLWEHGVPFFQEGISIAVERDPLEILKMGTYVGTCLGLGGRFADSAVAVLLDANKQALFARDRRGLVVGRQLVAISESDQLVCFSVYPATINPAIGDMFKQYDVSFAATLGLDLYRRANAGDDYVISNVASESWWDDGSWDFS